MGFGVLVGDGVNAHLHDDPWHPPGNWTGPQFHRRSVAIAPADMAWVQTKGEGSNVGKMRGARGGDVTIQRRRRDTKTVCDLSDADVGVGQHRFGSLDVVVGEFWRTTSGAARAPRGGKARWVRSRIRLRSNSANAPNM